MPIERLAPTDTFVRRHLGPRRADVDSMLATLGYSDLDQLVAFDITLVVLYSAGVIPVP